MESATEDNTDIFDQDDDNESLFASAIGDDVKSPVQLINPLPELPTLQLSVDKGPVVTPIDENLPDVLGVQSPPPTQKRLPIPKLDEQNGDESGHYIDISIIDTTRIGEGMGAYIVYKIETKTNIPAFSSSSFTVQRRFSDFLGLHDKLVEKFIRSGRIIPPAPEKSVIGMTKVKISGQNEQGSSNEFIGRRKASLERYLRRTAAHPVLVVDPDFKKFLESDADLPRATNTSALSGAGVLRLFNKVGETVNKMTYKMDENDSWFEEKAQEIECLESGLRRLHNSVENLVVARKELALYTGDLAKTIAMLSNCEEHFSLSQCLSKLRDLEEKIDLLHNDQVNNDFSILCELLKDYIALIGAIKDVFHERVKVFQNWRHAQLMLNKKKEQLDKQQTGKRGDRGSVSNTEITEWLAKVVRCQEEFNNISQVIKEEIVRFDKVRVEDFKKEFVRYMEEQMALQHKIVKHWENFLNSAKAIA